MLLSLFIERLTSELCNLLEKVYSKVRPVVIFPITTIFHIHNRRDQRHNNPSESENELQLIHIHITYI